MARLKLLSSDQAGLTKLQGLPEQSAVDLLSAIKKAAEKASVDGLTIEDIPEIPGLSKADTEEILDAIDSLYHIRAYAEVEADEFVSDVCNAMRLAAKKDSTLTKSAEAQFRERLVKFLTLEDVSLAAKSSVLRYEHERTVHGVRILTDARPIFGSDASNPPDAAVVSQTLKIGYHHAGHVGEMFFAFDEGDLSELKRAIHRAEAKATSLRAVLSKGGVKVFNLK